MTADEAACEDGAKLDLPTGEAGTKPGEAGATFGLAGDKLRGAVPWFGMNMAPVGEGDPEFFCNRRDGNPGDFFEGTVLLR